MLYPLFCTAKEVEKRSKDERGREKWSQTLCWQCLYPQKAKKAHVSSTGWYCSVDIWPLSWFIIHLFHHRLQQWQSDSSFLYYHSQPESDQWSKDRMILCDSLSSLLQNPYLLLTRSVMCKAHCSTCKVAQGKSMVILWTSTPCTGSNICLSSQAACEQHLARQDIWLN